MLHQYIRLILEIVGNTGSEIIFHAKFLLSDHSSDTQQDVFVPLGLFSLPTQGINQHHFS